MLASAVENKSSKFIPKELDNTPNDLVSTSAVLSIAS
jgi:hypothetical protein